MKLISKFILAIGLLTIISTESEATSTTNLVQLNSENLHSEISNSNYFVMFESACGFTRRFVPSWKELVQQLSDSEDRKPVKIGKVNCKTDGGLCRQYGATRQQPFKFFKVGVSDPVTYSGDRDVTSFISFIAEQTNDYNHNIDVRFSE